MSTQRRIGRALVGLALGFGIGGVGFAIYAAAYAPLEQGLDSRPAHIATVLLLACILSAIAGGITLDQSR